jgi:predicted DNA-binding transcriptional regulator AlpA
MMSKSKVEQELGNTHVNIVPELLRTREAAQLIGCSAATLEQMRRRGDGPVFIRVRPKFIGYRRADIAAWLESRVATKAAARSKQRD